MRFASALLLLVHCAVAMDDDEALVLQYTKSFGNSTFREASGQLKYPYLVPAGVYQELWDWDSMLTGTAMLAFGSAPYLAGSMMNFLAGVDKDGLVPGCLTPKGPSPAIYHAKPVVLQGAWIAAKYQQDFEQFRPFVAQMKALDGYWERTSRDAKTGLYRWHDQMESGCDNLVTSQCPSQYGSGPPLNQQCWSPSEAYTLASSDINTFLFREKAALANFLTKFGDAEGAAAATASAGRLRAAVDAHLWSEREGRWTAFNTSGAGAVIGARTHLMLFPVFGGPGFVSASQAARSWNATARLDMLRWVGGCGGGLSAAVQP